MKIIRDLGFGAYNAKKRLSLFCALIVFALWAPPPQAQVPQDLPPLPPCEVYRQGPLLTREIAVYSLPPGDDPDAFEMVPIHYRELYDFGGMSGTPDGRPDSTLLVDITITDGQPLPRHIRNTTPPQQQTFFTMLLRGHSYLMPAQMIAIIGGRPVQDTDSGRVIDGEWVYDPGPFNRTGEMFYGFERVTIDDGLDYARRRRLEMFIREDDAGHITSFIECSELGSVPNPGCSLYEQSGVFWLDYGFRRNQMHLLETIRAHAHGFAQCLTQPLSHGKGESDGTATD